MSDAIEAAAADVAHVMELWSDYTPMDLARVAIESYRDSEIEALRAQVAETRELLAHTVMGSLPNDWLLKDVAEARLHDMIALRNQVRDTCFRAEQAEATIADLRERHEAFVRTVKYDAIAVEGYLSLDGPKRNWLAFNVAKRILALCSAELGKEGK